VWNGGGSGGDTTLIGADPSATQTCAAGTSRGFKTLFFVLFCFVSFLFSISFLIPMNDVGEQVSG
jgi:hypothetical protein